MDWISTAAHDRIVFYFIADKKSNLSEKASCLLPCWGKLHGHVSKGSTLSTINLIG